MSFRRVTLLKFQNINKALHVFSEIVIFTEVSMNQLTSFNNRQEAQYLSELRKIVRHEVIHLLAVTERGTGQILDISSGGLSFGCLYPHTFPREFYLDILDAKGSHIKKVKVKKIWETNHGYQEYAGVFELMVGVEFVDLAVSQSYELDYLLDNLEMVDYSYNQI